MFEKKDPDPNAKCESGNTASDQAGCYSLRCTMEIVELDSNKIKKCKFLDCASVGGGGISEECYKVQVTGETYVGCGTTKNNTQVTTTAFGFDAGHSGSGVNSTFIGHSSGKVSTGASNTFIGHSSGKANTTGKENVFIGYETGQLTK